MKHFSKRSFGLALLALALVACSSHFTTQYDLIPPTSPQGLQCVTQCNQQKVYCGQNCTTLQGQCASVDKVSSAVDRFQFFNKGAGAFGTLVGDGSSFIPQCNNVKNCGLGCDQAHRDCFTACGGQLISKQVCTSNC